MFAKFVGRRITAVATALAVVVGLAITPAFTATAAEGDEQVVTPQTTEVITESAPPAEPPAPKPVVPPAAPPAPAPVEEVPAPPAETPAPPVELVETPTEEAPAPQQLMRSSVPAESSSMGIQAVGISPSAIGDQTLGQPVNIQFSVDADNVRWKGAYLHSLWSDLEVSQGGQLTGSFSLPGQHTLRVDAQVRHWLFGWVFPTTIASKDYTFNVVPAVTTAALPEATVGIAYSQTLAATRSQSPLYVDRFTVVEGSLPPGLTLNRNSGKIAGTVTSIPSSPVTYNFAVRLTSDYYIGASVHSAPQPLSITVGYPAPVVTTTTLPTATVGTSYPSTQLAASGSGVITWSATGLPAGLTLDAATGIISGTPDYNPAFGASATVPVTVTANNGRDSAPQSLSLTVNTPAPVFGSRMLPDATVGVLYDQQLPITDGYGTLDYTLVGGTFLPAGLELTTDGRILGTPLYDASAGASKQIAFRVKVEGTAGTDRQRFVFDLLTPAPVITTTTLADGWWNQPYSQPILVTGPGVTVTVTGLPTGLSLDGTNIVGKTRYTGDSDLIITAVNTAGQVTQKVNLTINGKPELLRAAAAKVATGDSYTSDPLRYRGEEVALSLGSDAPAGMKLNQNDRIKWTPSAPGVYKFTITATNPAGTDTRTYTIRVFDAPVITQTSLDQGVIHMAYKQKLQHDGTNVKFTIVRGALPDGLTLTKKGVIKGTATEAGSFTVKVRAKNAVGVDSAWFNLTVLEPAMTLSRSTIIRGNSLTVSGSGYLPGDTLELWLHSTPVLLGTVTATNGTFTSTVKIPANTAAGKHHLVVDAAQSGTQSVPLTIASPPAPQSPQPQGTPQSQNSPLTVTPADDTTEADVAEVTEVEETEGGTGEAEEEDLPTLDQPEAEEEAAAEAPANLSGLLYAAFALLLAALILWFILWRRRMATES